MLCPFKVAQFSQHFFMMGIKLICHYCSFLTLEYMRERPYLQEVGIEKAMTYQGYIQSWKYLLAPLVSKPYVNEVTLKEQNLSKKSCKSFKLILSILRRFRSSKVVLWFSVGQIAEKL